MKKLFLVVPNQALIAAIGNTQYLFTHINQFLKEAGKKPYFEVHLVGLEKTKQLLNGTYTIQIDYTFAEIQNADLIIIPPMSGAMDDALATNKECIAWLKQQHLQGAEIASLCVGAFLLADTGLLDNRVCSTHWQTANEFREKFPKVKLVDEKIITDHDGLYTSGGANSYWNLLIYLVEKFAGREAAIYASKYFEIDRSRDNQSLFSIFEGVKTHGDKSILKAQHFIEENYTNKITISQLSNLVNMSSRTFQRRFKQATYFTVHQYLLKVRVEHAKRAFETSDKPVSEVMLLSGYQSSKAFRSVFKKETGITPLAYREKYLR